MYVVSNHRPGRDLSENGSGVKIREKETEKRIIGAEDAKTAAEAGQPEGRRETDGNSSSGAERTPLSGRPGSACGELGSVPYTRRFERPAKPMSEDRIGRVGAGGSRFHRHSRTERVCPEIYGAGASCIRRRAAAEAGSGVRGTVLHVILAFFAAGFVTGCSIWNTGDSRQQCESMINGYLAFARGSGFWECFAAGLRQQVPIFIALAVSALFIAGYVSCPVLLFIRGMGSALVICSLLSHGVTAGSVCAVSYIALSTAVLTAAAYRASGMSLDIPSRRDAVHWAGYAARLVFYAVLLAANSAVHAAVVFLMNRSC